MSINNALITAAQDVLRSYLAPELAEKLTEEILERARPDIEAALTAMAGFEFAKVAGPRAKAAPRQAAKAAKAGPKSKNKESGATNTQEEAISAAPMVTVENYAAEAEAN